METRANYVLIGAFTLAVIAAAFGFVLWFQSLHTTKQRSPIRIVFEGPASGLRARAVAGGPDGATVDVAFSGSKVGSGGICVASGGSRTDAGSAWNVCRPAAGEAIGNAPACAMSAACACISRARVR